MARAAMIVGPDGRAKAYRPLPTGERERAIEAGLAAYGRGDWFEAHELLEPAWMGSADAGERAFLQGLIKIAAAYVHGVRGNPAGIRKNLVGARSLLGQAGPDRPEAAVLMAAIDERLADLDAHPGGATLPPPVIRIAAQVARAPRAARVPQPRVPRAAR